MQEVHVDRCDLSKGFYGRTIGLFCTQFSPLLPSSHGRKKVHLVPREFMIHQREESPAWNKWRSLPLFFPCAGGASCWWEGAGGSPFFLPSGKHRRPWSHAARLLLRLLCRHSFRWCLWGTSTALCFLRGHGEVLHNLPWSAVQTGPRALWVSFQQPRRDPGLLCMANTTSDKSAGRKWDDKANGQQANSYNMKRVSANQ